MLDLQPPALGTAAASGPGRELVILFPLEQSQASSRTPPRVKNSSLTSLMTSAWGGSSSGEQSATSQHSASQQSSAWSSPGSLSPSSSSSLLGLLVRITRDLFCASGPHLITHQVLAKPSTLCPAFPRAGAQFLPFTFLLGHLHSSLLSALRGTEECRRGGNYGPSLVEPCVPMPWPWPCLNTLKHSSTELERTNSPTGSESLAVSESLLRCAGSS